MAGTSKEYQLAIKIAGQVSSSFNSAMGDAESKLTNLGTVAQKAAAIAAAAWGALKIGEFVSDVAAVGSEYQTAFAQVQTIMDQTAVSTDVMSDAIVNLSNETGVAAEELAGSVYNAISATGDTANAVSLVADATKLATAGFAENEDALGVLTTIMNAYGISAEKASKISDGLIVTQNRGVTTVGDLSTSMGKAIATASAYSIDISNLEASYISMTKAGISTEESTTYLSSMFKELGDSGSDVAEIIKSSTGKSFGQLMNSGASLADVFEVLVDSVDGDSEALINLWSSAEAGKAANAIASQGVDYFRESLDALADSTGTTEEAYETMAQTLDHQTQKLSENFDNLKISIFDSFSTPTAKIVGLINTQMPNIQAAVSNAAENIGASLTSWIDSVLPKIEAFKDRAVELFGMASDGIRDVISEHSGTFDKLGELGSRLSDIFADIQDKAQPVLDYIFSEGIPNVVDGILTVVDKLTDLGQFLMDHKELVLTAIGAYAGFKTITAISDVGNKIANAGKDLEAFQKITKGTSLVTSVLNGKVSSAYTAFGVLTGKINLTELATEAVKTKFSAFTGGLKAIGGVAKTAFTGLTSAFSSIGTTLAGMGSKIMAFVSANPAALIIAAIAAVIAIVVTLYNKCEWFREKVDTIIEAVKGYLSAFGEKAGEVFQRVWGVIQEVWGQIQPYLEAAWQTVITAASAVVDFFQTNVLPGIKAVWDSIVGAFSAAWEFIKAVWEKVKPFFLAIWEAIKAVFSTVVQVLGGVFKAAWDAIQLVWAAVSPWFSTIWEHIKAVFSVVGATLGGFFKTAWEVVKSVWNNAVAYFQAIFDTITGIFSVVTSILQGDFSGAWEAIRGIVGSWGNYFQTVWDGIKNIFGAVKDWFSGIFAAAWNGVKNVFKSGINSVKNSASGFFDKLNDLTGGAVTRIGEFFSGLWEDIKSVWESVSGWFQDNVIQPLINFFTPIGETLSGIFEGCWIIIQAVWILVSTWFQDNVITPVVSFFSAAKDTISEFFSNLWAGIQAVWTAVSGWFDTNVIQPLVGFFSSIPETVGGFFSTLWANIQAVWAAVSGWFDLNVIQPLVGFFSPIVESIGGFFTTLWDNICSVWQAAGTWFQDNVATPINNAFQSVGDFVKNIFNSVIGFVERMINSVISGINKFVNVSVTLWGKRPQSLGWSGTESQKFPLYRCPDSRRAELPPPPPSPRSARAGSRRSWFR